MTIQQLQYLLEVYHTGSISRAAKNLYVSQSSVSISINTLESELGFPVFFRNWQGVTPTTRGLQVLDQASRICESYRIMTETNNPLSKTIRVGSAAYAPISDAFIRLMTEYQNNDAITFSHLTCDAATVVEKLSLFELDLGVLLTYSPHVRTVEGLLKSKGLSWTVGKAIPVTLRIGRGHRLYEREDISLRDFENDTLVDPPHGGTAYNEFLKNIMDINSVRVMLIGEQRTRYRLVSQGVAFSVGCKLPAYVNEQYGFRNIPIEGLQYNLITATNPLRPIPDEIQRFLQLLDEELAEI